jgi:hypothetical protein
MTAGLEQDSNLPHVLRVIARLMENEAPVTFTEPVVAERAAILELIKSARADGHLYDGDYVLRAVVDAIEARG